jgi:hypothetical protein
MYAGAGSLNAALFWGQNDTGNQASSFQNIKRTGSTWSVSTSGTLSYKGMAGCGLQNAALSVGGTTASWNISNNTSTFNGSTWSTLGGVSFFSPANNNRGSGFGNTAVTGATNAALLCGGDRQNTTPTNVCEKFNGSTWSTTGSLNTARSQVASRGTESSAMVFGGAGSSSALSSSEVFNGSTWAVGQSMTKARASHTSAGSSSSSAAAIGEGYTNNTISIETYVGAGGNNAVSLSVAEGALANSTIATLSASEAGMAFTKVAGAGDTDNASFNISGSDLITLANFDYETKASYSVRVRASNGSTTYENVVTIDVSNVNEAPSNITLSVASIQEGNAVNAVIGQLSAIDPDTGDTSFTFSISGGADAAKFNISGNDLRASQAFDYEAPADANADNVYVIQITAQDAGGLTYAKSFNISVSNNAADDSVAVSSSQVVSGTGGKVAASSANNPTTIPFLLNGAALPVGSVVRWTAGSNQKFLKIDGGATAFKALPVSAPASWGWSEAGEAAWATLQSF